MRKNKTMCSCCYNNFYNDNNPYGVKECWSYQDAIIVQKIEVSISQPPPYKEKPREFLNCYRRQRCAYIEPQCLDKDGYIRENY